MTRRPFYLLLLIPFLSCSKSGLFDLLGEYVNDDVYLIDKPIMYTANGAISTKKLIKEYLQRKGNPDYFELEASTSPINGQLLSIHFGAGDTVELQGMPAYSERATITSRTSDRLLISSLDSVTYFPLFPNGDRCQLLASKTTEVSPDIYYSTGYPLPGTGGFPSTIYKYRPTFPLLISGNNLYLPRLYYSISYDNNSFVHCTASVGGVLNTFNEGVLKELKAGDTMVVQRRRVRMVRK